MILAICEWLRDTEWSVLLRESFIVWPLVESTHVLALALFVGTLITVDLRLLGATLKTTPVSEVNARILPWTIIGFVVMAITGLLLFYAKPVHYYHNLFFRVKVILLIIAALNMWLFHKRVERNRATWDTLPTPPRSAQISAAVSLSAWVGVVITGRMMAYNWFDCRYQPQPDWVNLLASCDLGGA